MRLVVGLLARSRAASGPICLLKPSQNEFLVKSLQSNVRLLGDYVVQRRSLWTVKCW